jgi:hypothetical protein
MTNPTDNRDVRLSELEAENAKLRDMLRKLSGRGAPFICGAGTETGKDGLPEMIMVCPSFGLDGFAIYRKSSDYSAPSY